MKNLYKYILFIVGISQVVGQNTDTKYSVPLKDVLLDIENRYKVSIRFDENLVNDQQITYAYWRFRPDVETTLENVLASVNLLAQKEGDGKYKIKSFQYHRISVEEGKQITDYLFSQYNNVQEWETRKLELRECIWSALQLSKLPSWPDTQPYLSGKRTYKEYQIENVMLEVLPGLYTFGSVYQPTHIKKGEKLPVILCPNGHWSEGRYRPDHQIRCAVLAGMGAIVVSYDLFAWGESGLQFPYEAHHKSLAMTIQVLNSLRFLDYLLSFQHADVNRVAVVGGSGGGSHAMLLTAMDPRINLSVPTVMLSSYMYGGCPCESGMPVHLCGKGTNNVELAAMAAPNPQLIISDGKDWTAHVPEIEFPALQNVYAFYQKTDMVKNAHFPDEGHDFGPSKRKALYPFIAQHFNMDINKVSDKNGNMDESFVKVEEIEKLYVIQNKRENLPKNALTDVEELERIFETIIKK